MKGLLGFTENYEGGGGGDLAFVGVEESEPSLGGAVLDEVGCGGGGVVLYLSHASFVSGIIINPFREVGDLYHLAGFSLNMNISFP